MIEQEWKKKQEALDPLPIHSADKCSSIHPDENHDDWWDRQGDIAAENAAGVNDPLMVWFSNCEQI